LVDEALETVATYNSGTTRPLPYYEGETESKSGRGACNALVDFQDSDPTAATTTTNAGIGPEAADSHQADDMFEEEEIYEGEDALNAL
jgi:hypothetical protein